MTRSTTVGRVSTPLPASTAAGWTPIGRLAAAINAGIAERALAYLTAAPVGGRAALLPS